MTDRNTTIEVADSDTLPTLLDRIRDKSGAIRLVIPLGSSLFFTASEFQALKSVGEANGRTLTVASDDPLRQHLASMFDLPYTGESDGIDPDEVPAEASTATDEPPSPEPAPDRQPASTEAPRVASVTAPVASSEPPPPVVSEPSRSSNRGSHRRLFTFIGATIAAAIVIGLLAAIFFVPRATIAVHLKETPLDSSIIFGISTDESPQAGSEITITGGSVEADVTLESSAKATGQKQVPDKTASGKVAFSNPTTKEVVIAKGTKLTGDAGAVFVLNEQVKVPAGKGAQGGPGFADGKVTSSAPGTQGNLAQGDLSGKLDSGVYFSNRNEAMQGGTDRSVTIVSADDLDNLKKAADSQLAPAAETELDKNLSDGHKIVESSIAAGTTDYTFDHKEGDEVSDIKVTAKTHVTALDYNESDLNAQLTSVLTPKFQELAPNGYQLDPDSIQIAEPSLVKTLPHGAQYRVESTANAVATLTEDDQNQLADQLARKSNSSATTLLSSVGQIDSFKIDYKPAILPDRMPSNASRIEFKIDNAP